MEQRTGNITERIRPWVDAALARYAPNDTIVWETTLQALPGQEAALLLLVMWAPSPVLGTQVMVAMGNTNPLALASDEAAVAELVRGQVEQLQSLRTQALSEGLSKLPANGVDSAHGGAAGHTGG